MGRARKHLGGVWTSVCGRAKACGRARTCCMRACSSGVSNMGNDAACDLPPARTVASRGPRAVARPACVLVGAGQTWRACVRGSAG